MTRINEQEATALVRQMQRRMGLAHWHIDITFNRDDENYGYCEPNAEYQHARINVDLTAEHHNWPELIAHELAHCIVAELADFTSTEVADDAKKHAHLDKIEDRLCTFIARMPCIHEAPSS